MCTSHGRGMNTPDEPQDTVIGAAYRVDFARSVAVEGAESSLPDFPTHYDGPPMRLQRFDKIWLGKRSEIIDGHGILPASYPLGEVPDRRDSARIARALSRARQDAVMLEDERLLVSDWWSANYYHWLCDTLPRLEAWCSVRQAGDLMLPAMVHNLAFVRESLAAWPDITVHRYDPEVRPVRVEVLNVPTHVAHNGFHHPVFAPRAFARLKDHFGAGQGGRGRRLHVTRRHARMRRLANEDALEAVLSAHGFETVDFDGIPFADQVRLAGEAEMIAGAHGAGLANMAFMSAGGAVLEMRHADGPSNCFFTLSTICGHGHFFVAAEPPDASAHLHAADLVVSPDRLAAALDAAEQWLASKEKGPAA